MNKLSHLLFAGNETFINDSLSCNVYRQQTNYSSGVKRIRYVLKWIRIPLFILIPVQMLLTLKASFESYKKFIFTLLYISMSVEWLHVKTYLLSKYNFSCLFLQRHFLRAFCFHLKLVMHGWNRYQNIRNFIIIPVLQISHFFTFWGHKPYTCIVS